MNTLILIVIVLVIILGLIALISARLKEKSPSKESASSNYSYRLQRLLLSNAERSFYGVLLQAVGEKSIVFAKVRVADILSPQKGLDRSTWQRAFNAISAKHFDFIICDPKDCSVKLAVELDDSSHGSAKTQKRDNFLNRACESAGLPLLRIKAAKGYSIDEIKQQIEQALLPN